MQSETTTIGELTCRSVRPDDPNQPEVVVVLCHGFGAPGTDLVPLANEILRCRPDLQERIQFVFPEAPHSLSEVPGGRAWWPIDMLEMQMAIAEGRFRDMRRTVPPQLPEARDKLLATIARLQSETGVPFSRFVLGGFSQGSMLTTDVSLRLECAPGALLIYSGTLIAEPEWAALAPHRAGLRVLQTHGTVDPILPFEAAEWLRDMLTNAGLNVDFHTFPGVHTIPAEAIELSAQIIGDLLPPV